MERSRTRTPHREQSPVITKVSLHSGTTTAPHAKSSRPGIVTVVERGQLRDSAPSSPSSSVSRSRTATPERSQGASSTTPIKQRTKSPAPVQRQLSSIMPDSMVRSSSSPGRPRAILDSAEISTLQRKRSKTPNLGRASSRASLSSRTVPQEAVQDRVALPTNPPTYTQRLINSGRINDTTVTAARYTSPTSRNSRSVPAIREAEVAVDTTTYAGMQIVKKMSTHALSSEFGLSGRRKKVLTDAGLESQTTAVDEQKYLNARDVAIAADAVEREMAAVMKRAFCGRCSRTLVDAITSPAKVNTVLHDQMLQHLFQTQHLAYVEAMATVNRQLELVEREREQQAQLITELHSKLEAKEKHTVELEQKLMIAYDSARTSAQRANDYRTALMTSTLLPPAIDSSETRSAADSPVEEAATLSGEQLQGASVTEPKEGDFQPRKSLMSIESGDELEEPVFQVRRTRTESVASRTSSKHMAVERALEQLLGDTKSVSVDVRLPVVETLRLSVSDGLTTASTVQAFATAANAVGLEWQWTRQAGARTPIPIQGAVGSEYHTTIDDAYCLLSVSCVPVSASGVRGSAAFQKLERPLVLDPAISETVTSAIREGKVTFGVTGVDDKKEYFLELTRVMVILHGEQGTETVASKALGQGVRVDAHGVLGFSLHFGSQNIWTLQTKSIQERDSIVAIIRSLITEAQARQVSV